MKFDENIDYGINKEILEKALAEPCDIYFWSKSRRISHFHGNLELKQDPFFGNWLLVVVGGGEMFEVRRYGSQWALTREMLKKRRDLVPMCQTCKHSTGGFRTFRSADKHSCIFDYDKEKDTCRNYEAKEKV